MKTLIGRWRIVEMDQWDPDVLDLIGPAFIEFTAHGRGSFGFIAVDGYMDCRQISEHGRRVEFTFEGRDEGDPVSGRGWAEVVSDIRVEGYLYFHMGDESGFWAEPFGDIDRGGWE